MRSSAIVKKKSALAKLYLMPPVLKLITAFFVVVFLCVTSFSIMYSQAKNQLTNVDEQKKLAEDEVTKQAKSLGGLMYLSKSAAENTKNYEAVVKTFPLETGVAELLSAITKLGTENGLKFEHFRPLAPNRATYYVGIPIDILVIGKFHQIALFLSEIANLPGSVVSVDPFELRHTEHDAPGQLRLEFRATLYYVLPNAAEVKL
jgi:type IV pilus assembly protein PilO